MPGSVLGPPFSDDKISCESFLAWFSSSVKITRLRTIWDACARLFLYLSFNLK